MKDLFETPELIPNEVQAVLDTFNEENDNTYAELGRIVRELRKLGYTFNYGLDAEPYGLRPIGIELNQIEGYADNN